MGINQKETLVCTLFTDRCHSGLLSCVFSFRHFFPFCENSFDLFIAINVFIPCVFNTTVLRTWDLLVHQVAPGLVIVIFSVALLTRVIWHKQATNQPIQWRKHRKMTIQLLSISILYFICGSPVTIIIFASQYGLPLNLITIPLAYAAVLRTYVILLFPFVCCGSLSELRKKCMRLIHWRQPNQVGAAATLEMTRMRAGRTAIQ